MAKRVTDSKRKTRKKPAKKKVEKTTIPFQRAIDFKSFFSDAVMARLEGEFLVLSFYQFDRKVQAEETENVIDDKGEIESSTTRIIEESIRNEQSQVRIKHDTALQLVALILNKMQQARPDLVTLEEKKKKKK